MKSKIAKDKNGSNKKTSWKYLNEIDRQAFHKMPAWQKLQILADLYDFFCHCPKKAMPEKSSVEKLKAYQRMNRIIKNAFT